MTNLMAFADDDPDEDLTDLVAELFDDRGSGDATETSGVEFIAHRFPVDHERHLGAVGHPQAVHIYYELLRRSDADKRLVLAALNKRLRVGVTGERQEAAAYAIDLYMKDRGGEIPTQDEYEDWAKDTNRTSSSQHKLPSPFYIAKAFGGWRKMQAAFGATGVADVMARRLTALNLGVDELHCAFLLEFWCSQQPADKPLARIDFERWCSAERIKADRLVEVIPSAWGSYQRHLGIWRQALAKVGYPGRHASANRDRSQTVDAEKFTDEGLKLILRVWAGGVAGPLTIRGPGGLEHFLDEQNRQPSCGLSMVPVSTQLFYNAFGPLENMLNAAGIPPRVKYNQVERLPGWRGQVEDTVTCPTPPAEGTIKDRAWALFWVQQAARKYGPTMSGPQYLIRRNEFLRAADRDGIGIPTIPHTSGLISYYGDGRGWHGVKHAAGVMSLAAGEIPVRGQRYTDEALLTFVARVLHVCSGDFNGPEFRRHREQERQRLTQLDIHDRIPDLGCMMNRFGGRPRLLANLKAHGRKKARELGLAMDGSPLPYLWRPYPTTNDTESSR